VSSTFESKLTQKWNWGAFLLGPIWALFNQVWIGLIAWLPILLLMSSLVMLFISPFVYNEIFYISLGFYYRVIGNNKLIVLYFCIFWYFINVSILGFKGDEMALKAKPNLIKHPEQFKARQKTLSIFGFIFGFPLIFATIYCLDYLVNLNANLPNSAW
jgi:hypothetical protein